MLFRSKSKQHLLRIDDDVVSDPLEFNDISVDPTFDAVVVSDYNKGFVSYELIEQLVATKLPVFVDTKKTDLARLQGAWVKINSLEYSLIKSECTGLIVTRGEAGADLVHHNLSFPAPKVEVSDVCGAGDTFL